MGVTPFKRLYCTHTQHILVDRKRATIISRMPAHDNLLANLGSPNAAFAWPQRMRVPGGLDFIAAAPAQPLVC